ncbi:MAG TPA: bifunctional alpha,alpha-trehalose-phosphate synthase (UDP-forming)/trehalose-phosphatase [Flavobacterium sp.]|jgi:trehalose 6-phosphate synthase/phosphatase
MKKTIIVSNRLPLEFQLSENEIIVNPSVGGLATGLKSVHEEGNSLWVGWSGLVKEQLDVLLRATVEQLAMEQRCITVPLTEKDVDDFYFGFSNKALWPLFHYFLEYVDYSPEQWEAYKEVNFKFAQTVLEHAEEGDTIWVHDYQLLLLPSILKKKNPKLSVGFFLHIPFPAFEIIRTFPWREELLYGIMGADLIGFHTYDYVQHFLNSVRRIVGHEIKFNEIFCKDRIIKVDSFPMGIDYKSFYNAAIEHQNRNETDQSTLMSRINEHLDNYTDSKLILSIDRMDYTKGIPNRIKGFEYFLDKYPEYREKVRLVMLAVPSRSNVPQYQKLKSETDELVGRINGKFATINWTPIWYFYRSMPFDDLIDLYASSHVALISPIRDGMNLVAKEYVATRANQDGVIILSEMAGAASEMQEALLINPNNMEQFADRLKQALEMPISEQKTRITALQKRLARYSVDKWAGDFIKSLESTRNTFETTSVCKRLDPVATNELIFKYKQAEKKLLLFDYDGTLVDFKNNPEDAKPDETLYQLLDTLAEEENTELVIISGRGRDTIEKWFGHKKYTLITDHGVWLRRPEKEWEELEYVKTEWKENIRPVMESFVDRTPGAFIEEKNYSLVWHYRKADPDMSAIRTRDLKVVLTSFVADNGLSVLEGDKVMEVKSSAVNKGRAVTKLLLGYAFDYIFAIGDDWTDEYMFEELPKTAYTVKVGHKKTAAKYFVSETADVRHLLTLFGNNIID